MPDASSQASLERPIIVVGSARSGTTVLAELLSAHPDLNYENEPRLTWRIGNDQKSDMLQPADAMPEVVSQIRQQFESRLVASGKKRMLEKTPSNALRVGFVDRVMPDALFIHILRDPIEAAISIRHFWQQHAHGVPMKMVRSRLKEIKLSQLPRYGKEVIRRLRPKWAKGLVAPPIWGPRLPGIDAMARELDPLVLACLQWRYCVERACVEGRALAQDRYMELWLQDFKEESLRKVMRFVGLDEHPDVIEAYHKRFTTEAAHGQRKQATDQDIETIRQWTDPTMRWLGRDGVTSR